MEMPFHRQRHECPALKQINQQQPMDQTSHITSDLESTPSMRPLTQHWGQSAVGCLALKRPRNTRLLATQLGKQGVEVHNGLRKNAGPCVMAKLNLVERLIAQGLEQTRQGLARVRAMYCTIEASMGASEGALQRPWVTAARLAGPQHWPYVPQQQVFP